jgi:hypothetical protein
MPVYLGILDGLVKIDKLKKLRVQEENIHCLRYQFGSEELAGSLD